MAVDAGFPARLASLIQEERRGLQGFIALLKREEALLIATQIDALSALAEEKTGLYRSLQRLSDDRVVMFARLGAKVTDENIRIVLSHAPDALSAWDEVLALAGEEKKKITAKSKKKKKLSVGKNTVQKWDVGSICITLNVQF